jgi:hypothetical protein
MTAPCLCKKLNVSFSGQLKWCGQQKSIKYPTTFYANLRLSLQKLDEAPSEGIYDEEVEILTCLVKCRAGSSLVLKQYDGTLYCWICERLKIVLFGLSV